MPTTNGHDCKGLNVGNMNISILFSFCILRTMKQLFHNNKLIYLHITSHLQQCIFILITKSLSYSYINIFLKRIINYGISE